MLFRSQTTNFSFDTNPEPFLQEEVIEETPTSSFIFINIKNIILYIMLAVVIIVLILFLIRSYRIYQLSPRARSKNRRKRQIADAKKRQKKARRR